MAVSIVDLFEVVEVEHDERDRQMRSARAAQFDVEHFERVRAVETAGQAVAEAVLAELLKELRVAQRDAEQRCRGRQHAPPAFRERPRAFRQAEDADGVSAGGHRNADVPFHRHRVGSRPHLAVERPAGEVLACPFDLAAVLTRGSRERLPVAVGPHHRPRVVGAGQLRQVLRDDVADGFDVERAAERLAEHREALHLLGARLRGAAGFGRRPGLRLLSLALLMEQEHDDQNEQRRNQSEPRALDLRRDR
jgi:hypothetical protein